MMWLIAGSVIVLVGAHSIHPGFALVLLGLMIVNIGKP
jgi:hypothetical protein